MSDFSPTNKNVGSKLMNLSQYKAVIPGGKNLMRVGRVSFPILKQVHLDE
jgi:hypothetical protein